VAGYRWSNIDGYLFTIVVLVGLWAPKDDHDALDVGVAAFVILDGAILPLLRAVALRLVLASFNDLTF
jgi:hypothetical protein